MSTTHGCQSLPNLREDGPGELNMLSIFSWTSGPVWARTAQETATDIPSEQKADRHGRDSLISIHIRGRGGGIRLLVIIRRGVSCCWDSAELSGVGCLCLCLQGTHPSFWSSERHQKTCVDIHGVMEIFEKRNPRIILCCPWQMGTCSKWQRWRQGS